MKDVVILRSFIVVDTKFRKITEELHCSLAAKAANDYFLPMVS